MYKIYKRIKDRKYRYTRITEYYGFTTGIISVQMAY